MRTQTVNLNLIPGSVSPTIHLTQYDKDAGALVFNVYGEPGFYIPPNSTATITGTKPDGYGFSYSATVVGDVVTANVTQQMTAVAGIVRCELRITNGNNNVGSQTFYLDVKEAALDENTVVSDSDLAAIAMAEQYASSAAQSASNAAALIDTVNGLGKGVTTPVTSGSINAIVTPGYYYLNNNLVSDLPEGTNGNLWVYRTGVTDRVLQIFRRYGTPGSNDKNLYIRVIDTTGTDARSWWRYIDKSQIDSALDTKLSLVGGTMTGDLTMGNDKSIIIPDPDTTIGTPPSSNKTTPGVIYRDSTNQSSPYYGYLRGFYLSNGTYGMVINGAGNYFRIGVTGSNVPYVYVNNKSAWRTALNIGGDNTRFINGNVFTLESGYTFSNNRVSLYIHDNIAILNALLRGPVVAATNTKIATLKTGAIDYKPPVTVDFAVGCSIPVRGFLNSSGELSIRGEEALSNPYLAISVSWCLDAY